MRPVSLRVTLYYDPLRPGRLQPQNGISVDRTPSTESNCQTVSGVATVNVDDLSNVNNHHFSATGQLVSGRRQTPLSSDYTKTQPRVELHMFVRRTGGSLCGLNLKQLSGPF